MSHLAHLNLDGSQSEAVTLYAAGQTVSGLVPVTVTIAAGQSLSSAAAAGGLHLIRVVLPAAWTAANLTFQSSHDGTLYQDAYDTSGEITVYSATGNRNIAVPPLLIPRPWELKVRSGTAAAPVVQEADRVLTLVFARYL